MIKNMFNSSSVGIYDAAVRLSGSVEFYSGHNPSFFPAIINLKRFHSIIQKETTNFDWLFCLALIVAMPISMFSPYIIDLLYGASYSASASILSIYIWLGMWFSMFGTSLLF